VETEPSPEDGPVTAHRGTVWLQARSIALALLSCVAVAGCDVADATALDVNTAVDPNAPAVGTQAPVPAAVATGTTAPGTTNAPRATVAPSTPPPTKTPVLLLLPSPTPTKTVTPVTPVPTIAPPPPPPPTPVPTVAPTPVPTVPPTPVPTVAPTPVPGPKVAVLPSTSGARGTTFTLQLTGWPAGRVTETVTNPAGAVIRTTSITVGTNGTGSGTWSTKGSDPVGTYTLRFDMGTIHLTTSITLR
jgi:outer membrane biosynthesis protein TonB